MSLPKLDTFEEQQKKRFARSEHVLLEILDTIDNLECELSMLSDYLEEDDLMVAKNNLKDAYGLVRGVTNKRKDKVRLSDKVTITKEQLTVIGKLQLKAYAEKDVNSYNLDDFINL